jgi:hypothetical protein
MDIVNLLKDAISHTTGLRVVVRGLATLEKEKGKELAKERDVEKEKARVRAKDEAGLKEAQR